MLGGLDARNEIRRVDVETSLSGIVLSGLLTGPKSCGTVFES